MRYEQWQPETRELPLTRVIPETDQDMLVVRNAIADAMKFQISRRLTPKTRRECGYEDTRRPTFTVDSYLDSGVFMGTLTRHFEDRDEPFPVTVSYHLREGAERSGRADVLWTCDGVEDFLPRIPTADIDVDIASQAQAIEDAELLSAEEVNAEPAEVQADAEAQEDAGGEEPTE